MFGTDNIILKKLNHAVLPKAHDYFSKLQNVMENSYLALDDIEVGAGRKIPLYLFEFLY